MPALPKKELTLFDSTCLIVGIIIGAGIYETAPKVAASTTHTWGLLAIWATGGLLSLAGAMCYAELATAYPRQGGDYVYLTRAYGPWAGFLFGWVQLVVVRPGDIALMAFAFARYAVPLVGSQKANEPVEATTISVVCACLAVLVLTVVNIWGVRQGKWTQNVLTLIKACGLGMIVVIALAAPGRVDRADDASTLGSFPLTVAMIQVLFTFGGWNEMAYVAAEVKNPSRNIVRSLLLGTTAVTVLYLLANAAFLHALGLQAKATSQSVAADTVRTVFPRIGGNLISGLICISALGAVNGLIFTGARISYAVGRDHRLFHALGVWNSRSGTPIRSLLVQAAVAVGLILVLRSFDRVILFTAASVYSFYLGTSLAVLVLRWKDPAIARPYKVTGYPFTPLVFAATCAYLIYSALAYALGMGRESAAISSALWSILILVAGLPIYWISRRSKKT